MRVLLKRKVVLVGLFLLYQLFLFWLGRWSVGTTVQVPVYNLPIEAPIISTPLPKTFLLIAILSAPDETATRETIRNTWLRLSNKGPYYFRWFFPIGVDKLDEKQMTALRMENTTFGDLVFLQNITESYGSLAKKTASTINYAVKHYDFDYMLKVDSDSFVRINALLKTLRDFSHPRLYLGFLDGRAKPFRQGKWKEPDWMLCDRYLPYQLGGGYVISHVLADYVSSNLPLLKFYVSEDVSLGVWLAGIDTKYIHDPRFDTEYQSRGCNNEYIVTHKKTPQQMKSLFVNMQQTGRLCFKEFQNRPSYVYDFSVPPSQCCTRRNHSAIP